MGNEPLRKNNHYVPCVYLKRFTTAGQRVWAYRVVVSHPQVPLWAENSMGAVAWHLHLYTRIVAGGETDEVERWLDREIEAPADEAIRKATSDARMTPTDWKNLIRFVAAQDLRTPARFAESMHRWHTTLPGLMEDTMRECLRRRERAVRAGEAMPRVGALQGDPFPVRVTPEVDPEQGTSGLRAEVIAGRGLWLWNMRRLLSDTAEVLKVLQQHNWTVLKAPSGLTWFTSDDPVIRLNYRTDGTYDFGGGWGNRGTEIMLPLSPHHLLYTQVGRRPPRRGETMPHAQAQLVRLFVAQHAHRMVFAAGPVDDVEQLRPRSVNADLVREENEQWRKWHEDQIAAERGPLG